MAENIICFRESLLQDSVSGARAFYDRRLWDEILSNLTAVPRDRAENDPSYKQLVVYIIIKSGRGYLSYRRTPRTTESRLRLKNSIGIGGHVNTEDGMQTNLFDGGAREGFIEDAMRRELNEEVKLSSPIISGPEMLCFINDDSTDVGRVHFGVCWIVQIERPEVCLKGEKGIGSLEFLGLSELEKDIGSYENWSRIMIEYLKCKNLNNG